MMCSHTDVSTQAQFEQLEQLVVADPMEAVSRGIEAVQKVDEESFVSDQLRFRRMLAMAYAHTSQFGEALRICEEAASLTNAASEPIELSRVNLASMQSLAHLGRFDDAISIGTQAQAVFESANEDGLAGRAALNIGAINAMTGRHAAALRSFDQALFYLATEPVLMGQIHTNRGTSLAALDRFEEAETAFQSSVQLLGDELPWAAAVVEGNLADLASRQGAINRSLKHFEAARRYLEQEESLGDLGRIEAEEAAVLTMSGLGALANDAYTRAVPMLTEHGSAVDLALAKIGYARSLVQSGHLTEAEELLAGISSTFDPEADADLHQHYLTLAAQLALVQNRLDDASNLIDRGKVGASELPVQRIGWAILEARLNQQTGDDSRAEQILNEALNDAQVSGVTPLVATLNEDIALIARRLGKHAVADRHARTAIAEYDSIRGTIMADQLRQMWHHNKLGVFGKFASRLLGRESTEAQYEAFDIIERIRSRALLDEMGSKARDTDRSNMVSSDEQPLVDALNGHRRWLNWTYSAVAKGQVLSDEQLKELRVRERDATRLEDRLAILRPGAVFNQPVSIDDVQSRLALNHAVLSYIYIDDRLTLQVIRRDDVKGFEQLALTDDLAKLVSAMQFQVGRALASGIKSKSDRRSARLLRDMDAVLTQLYDSIILPAMAHLDGIDHLIIIPSGNLHSVPFAALKHNDSYLCDTMTIGTAPSVSVLSSMARQKEKCAFSPQNGLIVGSPDESAPGLGVEASMLAATNPNANVLMNEQATRGAVLKAMQGADWIHLACHGRFEPSLPEASGLKVDDNWITVDDLRHIELDQPLMVLSGCETGRARVDRGDDLVGLVTSLIASGANGLVMSLWKTHDEAGLALMTSFYEALSSGTSLAAAINQSQRLVRKMYEHPAMWAPLIGLGMIDKEQLI